MRYISYAGYVNFRFHIRPNVFRWAKVATLIFNHWRIHGGARDVRSLGVKILSFSYSLPQKFAKKVRTPTLGVAPPPPGKFWIRHCQLYVMYCLLFSVSALKATETVSMVTNRDRDQTLIVFRCPNLFKVTFK